MKLVRMLVVLLTLPVSSISAYAVVIDFSGFSGYEANSLTLGSNSWSFNENGYQFSIANSQDNSLSPPANVPNLSFPGEIISTAITVTRLDGNVFDVTAFSILGGIDKSSSYMEVQPQLNGQDVTLPGGGTSDFYYDAWNGGNTYY